MTNFISATCALTKREILRFVRQRSRWIGALATPLLFWALVGGGLGNSFSDPSGLSQGGYLSFFFPGTIALSVLFTAIFSTMSVIEDRHQGFLQGVLVSPIPRSSFVLAKVLGGALLGLLQGLLILLFAPLVGVHLDFLGLLETVSILFMMAAALTALGFIFAWVIDSVQGYHGVMNVVFIPMWILSGAVFPAKDKLIFNMLQNINPLTYGITAIREIFSGQANHPTFWPAMIILTIFFAVLFGASMVLIDRPAKT